MIDLANMERKLLQEQNERSNLEMRLNRAQLNEHFMEKREHAVKFYTGLPNFLTLMAVFDLVCPAVCNSDKHSLTTFQEFLVTLIRLRLNVPLQDLAYRFDISVSTACRIFSKWLTILDKKLVHLVSWPDRETLRKTMPLNFRQSFGSKVVVIIDCFEVFIERPSSLLARALTWSNYKHHNTVKFLIGITPQGSISYISEAWGTSE